MNEKYQIIHTITEEQAAYIHRNILQEEQIVNVDPGDIQQKMIDNHAVCIVDIFTQKPVGFVGTTTYQYPTQNPIMERGTLRVDPQHRGQKISSQLLNTLHMKMNEKPLICLTKVDKVVSLCEHRGYVAIPASEVQGTGLGDELETLGSIEGYKVFLNTHALELFTSLTNQ